MTDHNATGTDDIDLKPRLWTWFLLILLWLVPILGIYFYFTNNYLGIGILIFFIVCLPSILKNYDDIKYGFNANARGFLVTVSSVLIIIGPLTIYWMVLDYMNNPSGKEDYLWILPFIFGMTLFGLAGVLGHFARIRLDKLIAESRSI